MSDHLTNLPRIPTLVETSHACSHCKQSHRRCDKQYPTCGHCATKGKVCDWSDKPQKRGPKKEGTTFSDGFIHYEPYIKKPLVFTNISTNTGIASPQENDEIPKPPSPLKDPPMHSNMDVFFEHLFQNTPVLDKAKAGAIINFEKNMRKGGEVVINRLKAPDNDDMALIFAMQSWFYTRFRNMEQFSLKCFETSRTLLESSFDKVLNNSSVAVAFLYLGMYLINNNEISKGMFYLENTSKYVEKRRQSRVKRDFTFEEQLQIIRDKFVECMLSSCMSFISDKVDLIQATKRFIYLHFVTRQYKRLNDLKDKTESNGDGVVNEEMFDEFLPYLQHIKNDLEQNSDVHFKINLNVLDYIIDKFKSVSDAQKNNSENEVPTPFLYMRQHVALFLCLGAKIQHLCQMGRVTSASARRVAESVSILARSKTTCFGMPVFAAEALYMAISVHVHCLEVSKNNQERRELIEWLRSDIQGMNILGESSKLVQSSFSSIVMRAENAIEATLILMNNDQSYMNTSQVADDTTPLSDSSGGDQDDLEDFMKDFLTDVDQLAEFDSKPSSPTNEVLFW
ncbi:glucose transport transcription regulator RGT1 [Acrasis kona]|uniref:Glucose transport transcription regulator RGT1 n=1 Tax=Acrasis kona TaxID=1008807 RepID=A0AAW2ZP84_9EUKA